MIHPMTRMLTPGTILDDESGPLTLEIEKHLNRPVVITGGSGGGKTKLIELFCRQLISQGVGFTYLDPHGDGVDTIFQHLSMLHAAGVKHADPTRIHYVKPRADDCVRLDPFADVPPGLSGFEYADWLKATADRITSAFLRGFSVADQEMMARLQNWLRTIFFCCGVDVDGRHLGVGNAFLFTKPARPDFVTEWARMEKRVFELCPDTFYQIEELREAPPTVRDKLIESTVNCLQRVLRSGVMRTLVGSHAPQSLCPRSVILGSHIQLVNLRKTRFISRQQMNALGGLLVNLMIGEAEALAEELSEIERVPHVLIIDEAESFVGEDVRMGFAELRKFKMPMCLAFQDINCLLKGDLDLISKAFGNAGLLISFCQQDVESIEYLGKTYAYGSLDFTPLMVKQVLPNGFEWVQTSNLSVNQGWNHTDSRSESHTAMRSRSQQRQSGQSLQGSISLALSDGHSDGGSLTFTNGQSESEMHGSSNSRGLTETEQSSLMLGTGRTKAEGKSERHGANTTETRSTALTESRNQGLSKSLSEMNSQAENFARTTANSKSVASGTNWTDSQNITRSAGLSSGVSSGQSEGKMEGQSDGKVTGAADGQSTGVAMTFQKVPLAKHDISDVDSGSLKRSVNDQIAKVMNDLAALPDRRVLVKCKGLARPFLLEIHDVIDSYVERYGEKMSPEVKSQQWETLLKRLHATHDYYFVPDQAAGSAAKLARERIKGLSGDLKDAGDLFNK